MALGVDTVGSYKCLHTSKSTPKSPGNPNLAVTVTAFTVGDILNLGGVFWGRGSCSRADLPRFAPHGRTALQSLIYTEGMQFDKVVELSKHSIPYERT
jgi:hypothetical protein